MDEDDSKPKPARPRAEVSRSTREERERRLLDAGDATDSDPAAIAFQHTILCQTGLPYRNPGDDVRVWERINGTTHLEIIAGKAMHPARGRLVEVGLPYGPKPRLILAHLNTEALRNKSPVIEVGRSLTGFVKALNLDPKGRTINTIRDQLGRLAASSVRFGYVRDGRAITLNTQIMTAFELWDAKSEAANDDQPRFLWPTTVRFSQEYFESLTKHAVPLHNRALMALSGNAMGLDVYAWLAQRLHRIECGQRVFVPWPALQAQFGWHYDRLCHFKPEFRQTVRDVRSQYRAADVMLDRRGMTLRPSPPPVKGRPRIVASRP